MGPVLSELRAFLGHDEAAPAPAGGLSDLSERELEVLELVAAGMSNEQIAERLLLSPSTVERHLSNVYAKLRLSASPLARPPLRGSPAPDWASRLVAGKVLGRSQAQHRARNHHARTPR